MSRPNPIVEKYYTLTHKRTLNNPFRGPVLIVQIGWMANSLIFRTISTGQNWYYWDDYDYMYIGDLA